MSFGAIPPIDASLLPASVRTGSSAQKQAYTAALAFEQQLVQQLSNSLVDTTKDADGQASPYASLLPDALAQSVTANGGLGLAPELAASLAPPTSTAPEPAA